MGIGDGNAIEHCCVTPFNVIAGMEHARQVCVGGGAYLYVPVRKTGKTDMASKFYLFYLEIALRDRKKKFIYAFENVSHIPTSKLIDVFNIDIETDPDISEGYFLTKAAYKKHKKYLDKELPCLDFEVFEYCLRLYIADDISSIRKMYKQSLME